MEIKPPLHADHQLDQLAGQFEHWRQTRPHPSARIPQPLWDQAVALTAVLSPSRVAKQLRLRLADLNRRIASHQKLAVPPTTPGFVEVPPPPSWPQLLGGLEIEIHRPDGARLHIHAHDTSLPLLTIVESFLEAR
jgi:hypothetical protein